MEPDSHNGIGGSVVDNDSVVVGVPNNGIPIASSYSAQDSAAARARDTLAQLDNSGLTWFHAKTILIAGSGFLCDGYDLQCIGMITNLLGRIYYPDWTYYPPSVCATFPQGDIPGYLLAKNQGSSSKFLVCGSNYSKLVAGGYAADYTNHVPSAMPLTINFAINGVALCGTLTGQLLFGYLGDKYGRRSMFVVSLAIMVLFAFMSGLTLGPGTPSFIWSLCWFRFILGVGIGGDYPLSAVLMSEYSNKKNRGALVAAVFAQQGTGYLLASGMVAMFSAIFKASNANVDYLWRIILMFGSIPTVASMYFRITMPESPRYTLFNEGQAGNMVSDMKTVLMENGGAHEANRNRRLAAPGRTRADTRTFRDFFRQYGWILLGTSTSWFLLDIAFYSQGIYQSVIYQNIGWVPPSYTLTPADECLQIAKSQTYVNLASVVPGYWFTVFTVDYIGRWPIQFGGFAMMTLFNSILAGMYNTLYYNQAAFIGLYCMQFFFANWGPNATTFIIPAEVFPSKFRSFGHGFSAAMGKVGSIIGVFGFKYMTIYTGSTLPTVGSTPGGQSLAPALGLLAGTLGLGMFTTLLVPETKGKSLEDMGEDVAVDEELSSTRSPYSVGKDNKIDYYSGSQNSDKDAAYVNGDDNGEANKPSSRFV